MSSSLPPPRHVATTIIRLRGLRGSVPAGAHAHALPRPRHLPPCPLREALEAPGRTALGAREPPALAVEPRGLHHGTAHHGGRLEAGHEADAAHVAAALRAAGQPVRGRWHQAHTVQDPHGRREGHGAGGVGIELDAFNALGRSISRLFDWFYFGSWSSNGQRSVKPRA